MEREKRYVPVIVRFDADGKLRPLEIEFDESHKYPVDKILDVAFGRRFAAAVKAAHKDAPGDAANVNLRQ